jgi:hypothetical protein
MKNKRTPYFISNEKIVFDYSTVYCATSEELLKSPLFREIVERYINKIEKKRNSTFAYIEESLPHLKKDELTPYIITLLRLMSSHSTAEILSMSGDYKKILTDREKVFELIEGLYNFWRRFERFIYMEAPRRSQYTNNSLHHSQFIKSNEEFKTLILSVYRKIGENLTGNNPRIYRQLPAGANMGLLCEKIDWNYPKPYKQLADIPFIRLALLEPPVIFYPKSNKRKGKFEEINEPSGEMLYLNSEEWFCYPAKVGDLTAFIFFHYDYMSHGLSLCNLFEIAEYEDIDSHRPDIMLVFGLENDSLPGTTVFYEDTQSDMLVGLVRRTEEVDYFGYFKKMTLTLHNIAMLKRNRLPVHGAMVYLKLRDGSTANVVIVGDSGAGKSETIEALRVLADDHICEMNIIFDDMGSLGQDCHGNVVGYGTETGAFVRLDDLQPAYAYEEIDRSIFMNPDKTNSRLIMPVTRYHNIIEGYPVDIVLYANNYDRVTDESPALEFFASPEEALFVFNSGARFAKGTTDEKGLVHTYFANPFGAPQRKKEHADCARAYFEKMFQTGVRIGQIRTQLGIEGYEYEGPKAASLELFNVIREKY